MSGRPEINLLPYKDQIINLYRDGRSAKSISEFLSSRYQISVKNRTLHRRLQDWGVRRLEHACEDTPRLRARIAVLFFQACLTDKEMTIALKDEGFQVNQRAIQRIRLAMGIHRSFNALTYAEVDDELRHIVRNELDSGSIDGFGREMLYTHFRSKMHIISRDRLFALVKEIDPVGVQRRRHDLQRVRQAFIIPGPNYVWSIDGHDKLRPWGIEIYGAIDAYSRYVIWIYVGISNRTAISTLRQFLDTIADTNIQPMKIRSDRGVETPLLASAHFALRQQQDPNISFNDCYWFGTSTSNQRIESWWGQLSKGLLFLWRGFFADIQERGLFIKSRIADRIALIAIYIPILRQEIHRFVRTWNVHPIRPQKNREYLPTGKPYMMYHHQRNVEDFRTTPHPDLLRELQQGTDAWDIDEYLPADIIDLCNLILQNGGYSTTISQEDCLPDGSRIHCQAYQWLRQGLQEHFESQSSPQLVESVKPTGAWQWHSEKLRACYQTAQECFSTTSHVTFVQDEIEEDLS